MSCKGGATLAIHLRLLGLAILDLSIDTDDAESDDTEQVQGELSGRSVGFEWTSDVLPSVEEA